MGIKDKTRPFSCTAEEVAFKCRTSKPCAVSMPRIDLPVAKIIVPEVRMSSIYTDFVAIIRLLCVQSTPQSQEERKGTPPTLLSPPLCSTDRRNVARRGSLRGGRGGGGGGEGGLPLFGYQVQKGPWELWLYAQS